MPSNTGPVTPSQGGPSQPGEPTGDAPANDNHIVTPHGGVGGHAGPGPDAKGPVGNRRPGDPETRGGSDAPRPSEGGGYGFDPQNGTP